MDILEYLLSYWTNGFTTLIFVTLLLGSIPYLALWLDGKLEKLALQEILAELRNETDQPSMDVECVFKNLPNFRQAGGRGLLTKAGQRVRDGLLFRSSRTDFLTEKEKETFQGFGIKSIIDLRRKSEYERAEGDKILDDKYETCILKKGKVQKWKPSFRWGGAKKRKVASGDTPDSKPHNESETESTDDGQPSLRGRRYLVNMMSMDLIWYVFTQVNFFIRYISLILVVMDWLFGCHLFVRLFNWLVVNQQSLSKQYVDILEYTKPAVADILRLLISEDNIPVLVHCAHGKDRTGVMIAVILGCLGVEDELIAEDYAESQAGLAPIRERLYRETVGRYGFRKEFARADAETMMEVLKEVKKRYGSISEYLVSAGFSLEEQEKLRDIFLETSESTSTPESGTD